MTDGDRGDAHTRSLVAAVGHLARRRSRPVRHASATSGRSAAGSTSPTQSARYIVWPVVGRIWPSTSHRRPRAVGREEQQVGEAEVGEHPPLRHQSLQVGDLRAPE